MTGKVWRRSKTAWTLRIELGRDPVTGRRKQHWEAFNPDLDHRTVTEAKAAAETRLTELKESLNKGTFVDATKTTLTQYLRDWQQKIAPLRRPETGRIYLSMIDRHIATQKIGNLPLQKVRALDLEALYATSTLAPASIKVLHAVVNRALQTAVRDRVLAVNPARLVTERPKISRDKSKNARLHCWSAAEARRVLATAEADGPQISAFLSLAVDSGGRRSELLGLQWRHIDLDAGTITIEQQLEPFALEFAPTKTGQSRVVTLAPETIRKLGLHRKHQREVIMRNKRTYEDHQLVFAEDSAAPGVSLGRPCRRLPKQDFHRIVTAAGVKKVKFHGCRHTACTLLLSAGVPVHVVAARLGHAQASMTLDVYGHALPSSQVDAAARMGALLAG